jgi:Skp family chaperone for outer membrane proteins
MKAKAIVLCCLIGAIVLFAGHERGSAKSKADKVVANVGVVDVRKVFRDCKKNAKYGASVMAEEEKWNAEQEKLAKEIESQGNGLRALRPGSGDYLAQYKELLQKKAELETSRQFNTQQRTAKDQRWTEELYIEILKIVAELAEQKELDLVLQKDVADFPTESPDELMLTLSTHKLLYSGGCLDITSEVLARLDAEK